MERFWDKVEKTETCWVWTASKERKGYGWFRYNKKMVRANRFCWYLTHGEWPELHVLHKCDNTSCVNPDHLFLGTNLDNVKDKVLKNRASLKLTPDDICEIRKLSSLGESHKSIAKKFGVCRQNIDRVVSGKYWSHIKCSF